MNLIVVIVTKVMSTTSPGKPFKEAAATPTEWEAFQINSLFSHGSFSFAGQWLPHTYHYSKRYVNLVKNLGRSQAYRGMYSSFSKWN